MTINENDDGETQKVKCFKREEAMKREELKLNN
jgi:hypothetical protein